MDAMEVAEMESIAHGYAAGGRRRYQYEPLTLSDQTYLEVVESRTL